MAQAAFEPSASALQAMVEKFQHWVGTVWVDQHEVPTTREDLAGFDVTSLIPEYRAYMDSGGTLDLDHGVTMEQNWLSSQLIGREPLVCFINSSLPPQPSDRITRLAAVSGRALVDLLMRLYSQEKSSAFLAGVYDGGDISHVVALRGMQAETGNLLYWDPWPGRSLLCEENNSAGVAAQPVSEQDRLWMISRPETEAVLQYILLPESKLAEITTPADFEPVLQAMEKHDFFQWFHLERTSATTEGHSRIFEYRPTAEKFQSAVSVNLLINPQPLLEMTYLK